ncbi:MAG: Sulfhydrogenase 1 subunit gamma [Promethearchaeota archaeon]|nr:MAG: Sulfhydrogenase 1 subunit gamma [Candidatus Lokiarchaeota archaeon]
MNKNQMKTVKIHRIEEECKDIKTFTFNLSNLQSNNSQSNNSQSNNSQSNNSQSNQEHIHPLPGQFVMVWIPGVDEIPMSVSDYDEKGNWSITVKKVGNATEALHNLAVGDYIGVRGPFGNSFSIPTHHKKALFLIGGGIGMAPLKLLAKEFLKHELSFSIIEGAKENAEILYEKDFESLSHHSSTIFYCTDDGSYGKKGFASDIFIEHLKNYSKEDLSDAYVYTCGPEKMMFEIFKICEQRLIPLEASLERMMRCGCGLCGLCALDPLGLLVCKDGPVFTSETLRKLEDFGSYKRDFTGNKLKI